MLKDLTLQGESYMAKLKSLPVGIQTLADIINGNYIYVDKTRYLYQLVKPFKGVYFSSPARVVSVNPCSFLP